MEWNKTIHEWVLTIEEANDIGNVSSVFGSEDNAERELKSIARTIYNYIHSYGSVGNRVYVDWHIYTDASLKDVIYRASMAQLEAHLESGLNDLKKQVGVNIETGQVIDKKDLKDHSLCVEAEDILVNGDGSFNICYAGYYFNTMKYSDYEELGF